MMIGELIAIGRECKGWTLRDLEKASGVSNALISQIENLKVRDPGFSTVVRLIDALGISMDRAAGTARIKIGILRDAGVDASGPLPAQGEAEGWMPVPVKPTMEMLNAAIDVDSFKLGDISPLGFRMSPQQLFERCWSAMLSAAPIPAQGESR